MKLQERKVEVLGAIEFGKYPAFDGEEIFSSRALLARMLISSGSTTND